MATRTAFTAHFQQSVTPNALRAYLAEFISTFIFVLAAAGSAMASREFYFPILLLISTLLFINYLLFWMVLFV